MRGASCTCSRGTARCTGSRSPKPPWPGRHPTGNPYREVAMHTLIRAVVIAALTLAKGPPWISIELPVNPYDQSQRGTFLLVHSFHHGTAMGYIVTGTAEGIVKGERRTVKLEFTETARQGGCALRPTRPHQGTRAHGWRRAGTPRPAPPV